MELSAESELAAKGIESECEVSGLCITCLFVAIDGPTDCMIGLFDLTMGRIDDGLERLSLRNFC